MSKDIARVTHFRKQLSILVETMDDMSCCRGIFSPLLCVAIERELLECHTAVHSIKLKHQMQTCNQIDYWTCRLMVETLEPSRNYQHSDCALYCLRYFVSGENDQSISNTDNNTNNDKCFTLFIYFKSVTC